MKNILLVLTIFILSSCSSNQENKEQKKEVKKVAIKSVHDISKLFEDLNYTSTAWVQGNKEVPRIVFSKIGKNWKHDSSEIPVKEKKNIFFRLMAPLVLISNEEISKDRIQLLKDKINSKFTIALAKKYRILKKDETTLTKEQFIELKKRVDIIPLSLALAQGAEESGWATSRFASEGNALFGQWDYSGKGMKPKQQRKELGNYGLARFDTPLDSVKGYMKNINTGHAYEKFRNLRYKLRQNGIKVTGWELAKTLDRYSERGQAYIDSLHNMMSYNKLRRTDDAYLSKGPKIILVKSK